MAIPNLPLTQIYQKTNQRNIEKKHNWGNWKIKKTDIKGNIKKTLKKSWKYNKLPYWMNRIFKGKYWKNWLIFSAIWIRNVLKHN